jgi:hypothetical protein
MRRNRVLYSLLSLGAIGAFLGHGMFAVERKESFIQLFTGSFDNVLGVTVSTGTASDWVFGIGVVDLTITVVLAAMLLGNTRAKGALYQLAYSNVALVLYAWGAFWGFVTAASRVTAAGDFYPFVWDVVERAPNFLLPAALVYLVHQHRLDHSTPAATAAEIRVTAPIG